MSDFTPNPKPKKKTKEEKWQEKIAKRRKSKAIWRDRAIRKQREKRLAARKKGQYSSFTKRSKRVDQWNKIRTTVVDPMFKALHIDYCEVTAYLHAHGKITSAEAIERNTFLSYHHRHKRDWYKKFGKKEAEMLGRHDQVIKVGQYYHKLLEPTKRKLTVEWFEILRGKEELK